MMNIRITKLVPKIVLISEIAEKLIECEVSLITMMNPEGYDLSETERLLGAPEDQIGHQVDVDSILFAIKQKHGDSVHDEIRSLITKKYGGLFLISTISIPITCCEVI